MEELHTFNNRKVVFNNMKLSLFAEILLYRLQVH